MFTRILIIVVSILFGFTQIHAQDVEEIIKKSLESRGDVNVYNTLKSLSFSGKQSQMGMNSPFTYTVKDKKCRFETEAMGSKQTLGYDGDTLWADVGGQLQIVPKEYTDKVLPQIQQIQNFIEGPLLKYKEEGDKIEFSGNVSEEGKDAFVLKLISDEEESFLYIDKATYELFKIGATVKGKDDQDMDVELKYSDYKKVNGFSFPFKIELIMGEGASTVIDIEKIEINGNVDDKIFKAPVKTPAAK